VGAKAIEPAVGQRARVEDRVPCAPTSSRGASEALRAGPSCMLDAHGEREGIERARTRSSDTPLEPCLTPVHHVIVHGDRRQGGVRCDCITERRVKGLDVPRVRRPLPERERERERESARASERAGQ
jgi:hypothetical protein